MLLIITVVSFNKGMPQSIICCHEMVTSTDSCFQCVTSCRYGLWQEYMQVGNAVYERQTLKYPNVTTKHNSWHK